MKSAKLRKWMMGAVIAAVLTGASSKLSWGSLSGFGAGPFSLICPLGYLETTLASRLFIPRLILPFAIVILMTVVLGRFFCSWVCPIPLLRGWLPFVKKKNGKTNGSVASNGALANGSDELKVLQPASNGAANAVPTDDSRTGLWILAGTLLSSAIFGFPVFCLICPIGLTFGTLFAVMRLFRFAEPTITLLLFPAIVTLELVVLRKWCSRFCPIGALLGLVSRFNKSLVPRIDSQICLVTTRGTNCQICRNACDMDIDLRGEGGSHISNCAKCRDCAEKCPVQAIRFPWWRKS